MARTAFPTHRDRGAAAVEMAFMTMLLVLLVCGVVDLGRAIYSYIGIQDAAQEGARYAAYNPGDAGVIKARAADSTDYPVLDPVNDIQVACGPPGAAGDTIVVTVSAELDYITPVIGGLLGGTIDLSHSYTVDVLTPDGCL